MPVAGGEVRPGEGSTHRLSKGGSKIARGLGEGPRFRQGRVTVPGVRGVRIADWTGGVGRKARGVDARLSAGVGARRGLGEASAGPREWSLGAGGAHAPALRAPALPRPTPPGTRVDRAGPASRAVGADPSPRPPRARGAGARVPRRDPLPRVGAGGRATAAEAPPATRRRPGPRAAPA